MNFWKIVLCIFLIVSLCACSDDTLNENVNIEESDVQDEVIESVEEKIELNKDTLDTLLTLDKYELFDVLNVVTFVGGKLSDVLWESVYNHYDVDIVNASPFDIKLTYVDFNAEMEYTGDYWLTKEKLMLDANSAYSDYLMSYDKVENAAVDSLDIYEYSFVLDNYTYRIRVDIKDKSAEIGKSEIKEKVNSNELETTYLPNNGYTIFVWNDNGEYSFDVLRGIEDDGCIDDLNLGYYRSVNDVIYSEVGFYNQYFNSLLIFDSYNGELDDSKKTVIDNVMKRYGYPYVFADEIEKIEEAKNQYGTFHSLFIVENSEMDTCEYEYCLLDAECSNFEYYFTDEQKANITKGDYTLEEISDLIKSRSKYSFYARGAEQPLTSDETNKLLNYFDSSEYDNLYKIRVEGQVIYGADKPAIYLYPEEKTNVHIRIENDGNLLTTYPKYTNGWNVIAYPDGTIFDLNSKREYEYLFWEGESYTNYDMNKGFVVAREDTVNFLEEKLTYLGLNNEEMNEFIVYWLPQLEKNVYNYITFQSEVYENTWKLNVDPTPDSMIRVFMVWYGLETPIEVEEPMLTKGERNGFTLVEWGGTEIK